MIILEVCIYFFFFIFKGFAHHLVGMHSHLHAPDWRTLGGGHAAALGRPPFSHGSPFFHHQPAAFPGHVGALDRQALNRVGGKNIFFDKIRKHELYS